MSAKIKLNRTLEENEKIAPQAKVFDDELVAIGVGKEVDRAELVKRVEDGGNLTTRQPVDRVLGYYMQHFKKIGLAESIKAPKPPKEKKEKPAKGEKSPAEAIEKPAKAI